RSFLADFAGESAKRLQGRVIRSVSHHRRACDTAVASGPVSLRYTSKWAHVRAPNDIAKPRRPRPFRSDFYHEVAKQVHLGRRRFERIVREEEDCPRRCSWAEVVRAESDRSDHVGSPQPSKRSGLPDELRYPAGQSAWLSLSAVPAWSIRHARFLVSGIFPGRRGSSLAA